MGKKSRRTKGHNASRPPQSQSHQPFTLTEDTQNDDLPRRKYFVGDHVWLYHFGGKGDGSNPNTYRCIIHEVEGESLGVISLQSKIYGTNKIWRVHTADVFPDFCDMTLRFNVGDAVVCKSSNGWVPRVVEYQWPILEVREFPQKARDHTPHYKCDLLEAPLDDDDLIMECPSSFRFSIGQSISFDPKKAIFISSRESMPDLSNDCWHHGIVCRICIAGRKDGFFVYECRLQSNEYCLIRRDNDEFCCAIDASPRERLFDAIAQDCTHQHFSYLTALYNIEITATFRGVIVDRAVKYESYNTFVWLQEDHNFDIHEIEDEFHNNLLHQIAKTEYASHFLDKLAPLYDNDIPRLNIFQPKNGKPAMVDAVNCQGQFWLDILVDRADVRALDTALSLNRVLSWEISQNVARSPSIGENELLKTLKEGVGRIQNTHVKVVADMIIERFVVMCAMKAVYDCLDRPKGPDSDDEVLSLLPDKLSASRFIRFLYDFGGTGYVSLEFFARVVREGHFRLFELLYDADKDWFWNCRSKSQIYKNENEYIQPELSPGQEQDIGDSITDITEICMIGDAECKPDSSFDAKLMYALTVKGYIDGWFNSECSSLLSHLKRIIEVNESYACGMVKYKVSLLEDSPTLDDRLKILSRAILDRPIVQFYHVFFAIQYRQCGLLRWIIDNGLVDVGADVKDINLSSPTRFCIIDRFLPSMPLGCYLCYFAVRCDDLFSLQWLCEKIGYPSVPLEGLNLLHFAAFSGRIEIIHWLSTTSFWSTLVNESCAFRTYDRVYSVHIAAGQGHVGAADLLLKLGCREYDEKGGSPEYYAEQAPFTKTYSFQCDYKFAHDWGRERRRETKNLDERNLLRAFRRVQKVSPDLIFWDHDLMHFRGCRQSSRVEYSDYRQYMRQLRQMRRDGVHVVARRGESFQMQDGVVWKVVLVNINGRECYPRMVLEARELWVDVCWTPHYFKSKRSRDAVIRYINDSDVSVSATATL